MAELPAPLLSRQVGVAVIALSILAGAALATLPPLGFWPLAAALVLAAVQHAVVALAVLIIGRTGLAGRHASVPVVATFGSAALLLISALAEVVVVFLAGLVPAPPLGWLPVLAAGLAAATGLMLTIFGLVVVRAAVVRGVARLLPLVGGVAVLAAAVPLYLDPLGSGQIALGAAVLLLAGIGLALFTPRTLR
jgi:hypothetical protein